MSTATTSYPSAASVTFNALPFEEQKAHFLDVAKRALPYWGYPEDSSFKLLNITENATYLISHEGYEKMIMRVHRLDYASVNSIKTEQAWIRAIQKDTDLKLPTPIPAKNGQDVITIETPEMNEKRNVVCFTFEAGKSPSDSQDDTEAISNLGVICAKIPNAITLPMFKAASVVYDTVNSHKPKGKMKLTENDCRLYQKLGEIAATLHKQGETWKRPEYFERISWDWDGTFGPGWNNYYGKHYRDCDFLSERDCEAIDSCVYLMQKRIEAYGKDPSRYGLIHSDLRMSNLLENGDDITVLDFDDFGQGWYLTDIAGIVGFMEHRPDLDDILDQALIGYQKVRKLTDDDIREVPTFVMMRRIGLIECLQYHLNNVDEGSGENAEITPEIMAFFCKGTVMLCRRYIKKFKDMPLASPVAE